MEEQRHRIDTPVGPLAVRVTGVGAPAVLWHSLFVDDRSWDRVVPALSRDRRLVSITGPGHGTSGDPGRRYSMQDCAEGAAVVLDRLGIAEAVDWVGNAWGGHVGVVFASTWPTRCRSLVAFGAPVAALTRRERRRTLALLGLYRLLGPTRTVVDGVTKVLLSERTRAGDAAAVRLVQECLLNADVRMLCNAVVSISLNRVDLVDRMRRVAAPTLIVTGSDHQGFTPQQAQAAAELLPHGEAEVIPNASYLVPLEAPEAAIRLLRGFWAERVPSPVPD